MGEIPDLSDKQMDYLADELGLNLKGTQAVANDTKQYFVERADEEGLSPSEMLTAIRAVADLVDETIVEAMGDVTEQEHQ